MASYTSFPEFKTTVDEKHNLETYIEDLIDYCIRQNWYDTLKETDEPKWTKPDKTMACLRASLSPAARRLYKYHTVCCQFVIIDGKSIKKAKEAKSLGLFLDEHLSLAKHIEEISKKISSAIGALERIRPFISESTAVQIYQALVLHHFDYCSPVALP